ncbi:polysaccharide biosynthesis tyrosine autokinase [Microbacterium sp.]|uniref:polysaccharide biosynthesis tyrosine autokinase n=1 Tax=Microbacterium sp. TaxID=51671 RepID=UPI0027354A76|nr:polysaccharide biosynthesis tyrosine autokinase [Microbacterium sp.]MDP3949122.1 polysaccharide biosynthesis tyrosine autokinase [Microbacterium sp.]
MELRDYFVALRRHALAIVLLTLIGLGVSYGWAKLQTPVYEASASGFVKSRDVGTEADVVVAPGAEDAIAKAKVDTYLDMARWRTVAEHAAAELELTETPEQLVRRITVENPTRTAILRITAQGSSPESARDLASAWVRGLTATIDQFDGDGTEGSSPVTVILGESAVLPEAPAFPDIRTAVVIGGIIGFAAGIAFAFMRAYSDRRIRVADDVEQRLGVSVLGAIPTISGLDKHQRLLTDLDGSSKSSFAVSESLRVMRTNLQFMDVDHPPRRIVITSALPGEGKSTVAANLAAALAANGEHVVLVDGDLRRPTVARTMGLAHGAGLTDVLAGRADLADVLQRAPGMSGLLVLGAGTTPPNPSELLGSDRMKALLDQLADHATVIIDAPPLLPITDGAILTHQADGAILVIAAGSSTYDIVGKAMDAIEKVHGRVLGVVLNRVALSSSGTRYGYGYQAQPPEDEPVAKTPRPRRGARQSSGPRRAPADPADAYQADETMSIEDLLRATDSVEPSEQRPGGRGAPKR